MKLRFYCKKYLKGSQQEYPVNAQPGAGTPDPFKHFNWKSLNFQELCPKSRIGGHESSILASPYSSVIFQQFQRIWHLKTTQRNN